MSRQTMKWRAILGALAMAGCATTTEETQPTPAAAPTPPAVPAPPPPPPTTPDAPFRASKPPPLATPPHFDAPVPVQRALKNGLQVLIVENHQVPLVVAELMVKAGMDTNPLAKPGLAEFTAAMLEEGTKTRTAPALAEQLEDLAAQLHVSSSQDSTRVHLNCLTETLSSALELMADVALHPAFHASDVDRVKKAYLTDLAQRRASPAFIAQDTANRVLYGAQHPWGQPVNGTEAVVSKLAPKELASWHGAFFVPANAVLTVSGDVHADDVMALLEERFGGWKGRVVQSKVPALPAEDAHRKIDGVDHPGSQSVVVVTHRMLTAADPDAVPMRTANYILGGLFSSRLNLNLREDKAYSYGVRSALNFNDRTGVFAVQGNIIAEHTPEAIVEMEKELARFATGEVTPDELTAAKSAYVRSLPSQLETNDAVASSLDSLVLDGLPVDYYAQLPGKVAAVTDQDVARVAKKYVQPEQWTVVVVGPVAAQRERLTALNLGPVETGAVP